MLEKQVFEALFSKKNSAEFENFSNRKTLPTIGNVTFILENLTSIANDITGSLVGVGGIVLGVVGSGKMKRAVDFYNNSTSTKLGITNHGVGFSVNF